MPVETPKTLGLTRVTCQYPARFAHANAIRLRHPTETLGSARLHSGPRSATARYGGNTSCVEVRADGEIIVLDAGSGIRLLGMALEQEFGSRPINLTLLITHVHWDHIQGFPFFLPAYNDKNEIHILGYDGADSGLREILKGQMATPFFPVRLYDLPGKIDIRKLDAMDFQIGKVRVARN